jgi:hypothetical protein
MHSLFWMSRDYHGVIGGISTDTTTGPCILGVADCETWAARPVVTRAAWNGRATCFDWIKTDVEYRILERHLFFVGLLRLALQPWSWERPRQGCTGMAVVSVETPQGTIPQSPTSSHVTSLRPVATCSTGHRSGQAKHIHHIYIAMIHSIVTKVRQDLRSQLRTRNAQYTPAYETIPKTCLDTTPPPRNLPWIVPFGAVHNRDPALL